MRAQVGVLLAMMLVVHGVWAEEPAPAKVTRIGAVASSPGVVTVFQGLTRYLNEHGLESDFVLYSSYDALVAALDRNEVEIAWNTPLAHGQYHVKNQCASRTLAMRDVDRDVCSVLVVRSEAKIKSLADLAGKRLVLGSSQAAEATVLPLHFLRKEQVDLEKLKIVSLDSEVDGKGNPCASPQHVLQALLKGRGDAGVITTDLWEHVRRSEPSLQQVWVSPPFTHCVFTAATNFDEARAARFTKLMLAMNPDDEATRDVMRLEGTRKWLPATNEGFADLVEALGGNKTK